MQGRRLHVRNTKGQCEICNVIIVTSITKNGKFKDTCMIRPN